MIKCINNKDYENYLTLNKMYKSLGHIRSFENNNYITLVGINDDNNLVHYLPIKLFINIAEERDITLTKLGI